MYPLSLRFDAEPHGAIVRVRVAYSAMGAKLLHLAWALAALVPHARAFDEYPARPVRMVVGAPAGDSTDLTARFVAPGLAQFFGKPFVVENQPGASGNVAAIQVKRMPSDGHSLLVVAATFSINISVYPGLPYHPERDFVPIARLARLHHVLVVNNSVDAASAREFFSLVRALPDRISIASAGSGSTSHLAAELLMLHAGYLSALHVPYRGSARALAELLGGHVHAMVAPVLSVQAHVLSGRVKALAVASRARIAALPQVPTLIEVGVPRFDASAWVGVVAPARTRYDTVVRLNLALTDVLRQTATRHRFSSQGAEPVVETPEEFREYLRAEIAKWSRAAKEAESARR
jgi:tripartite-type tricarboxylate transporter receptor subunit TctC